MKISASTSIVCLFALVLAVSAGTSYAQQNQRSKAQSQTRQQLHDPQAVPGSSQQQIRSTDQSRVRSETGQADSQQVRQNERSTGDKAQRQQRQKPSTDQG